MNNKKKTAAIYNRWLFTLGGGEQVTFAYAEALRDLGFETVLLTHKQVNIKDAESKMNVNLKNVSIHYIPFTTSKDLTNISKKYDVFINTSYLDYFPNASKNGILSVFFPGEIHLQPWEYCKRVIILPILKRILIYPTQFEGFEASEDTNQNIKNTLGKVSTINFSNKSSNRISLELYFSTFSFSTAETLTFICNGKPIKPISHRYMTKENSVRISFKSESAIQKISIQQSSNFQHRIQLKKVFIPSMRFYLYVFFKSFFPKWEMRLHGGPERTTVSDLKSYNQIITISKFCQNWIKKYWDLPSKVLYPPVNTKAFAPAEKKKNWITHIGRFFVTGHSKKQLELIHIFKDLVNKKLLDESWELHFIGSVHEGKIHEDYFNACKKEAQNYPIHFHIAIPFSELQKILSQSKIYWHATGLDEDPNKNPILMEHFGITTVEAMASGCVPIVIDAGGQPEIIQPQTGFVWKNREELKKYTVLIATNEDLRKKMMKKVINRSNYFSIASFRKRFEEMISNS